MESSIRDFSLSPAPANYPPRVSPLKNLNAGGVVTGNLQWVRFVNNHSSLGRRSDGYYPEIAIYGTDYIFKEAYGNNFNGDTGISCDLGFTLHKTRNLSHGVIHSLPHSPFLGYHTGYDTIDNANFDLKQRGLKYPHYSDHITTHNRHLRSIIQKCDFIYRNVHRWRVCLAYCFYNTWDCCICSVATRTYAFYNHLVPECPALFRKRRLDQILLKLCNLYFDSYYEKVLAMFWLRKNFDFLS
ncbi:uncharacterized protein BDR25DRAFT_390716 [Lindgomyces ingoldianus]|uniref:Uncharacterized protein n=1 Tax=Lindgomyces ingoldianus TaxID=673940 RepID=A0ACB6RDA0_9PLEO|nr:uncharacterized protein BDR25DRAFT_390716 [Lindgomyces ingoldianus]KAF2477077.1 hypothetical protein BDR25DRAFT_390716 [Lindgomyces ingoldianus]